MSWHDFTPTISAQISEQAATSDFLDTSSAVGAAHRSAGSCAGLKYTTEHSSTWV
ncbi:hypothetical protein CY34DRAFT_812795 [Suillus luteus UH-Slu-Lm8-n1]|uniref:Uncharacterized protein n=1 Tax=Suillus luteus UH-Slu-Lm8-n1 TaxID=930992 RepID=A0A0D0AK34_9AGAM|nr:hypothetical protein CY34DRAFT_812795 [Suillus luteus UH-Slu-Lm8-n1]